MRPPLGWPLIVAAFAAALAGCGFAGGTSVGPAPTIDAAAGGTGGATGGSGGTGGSATSKGGAGGGSVAGSYGTAGAGGGDGGPSGSSNPDSNCGEMSQEAKMVPPDILIVQDRSLSMTNDANDKPCAGGTNLNGNCGANSKWAQVTAAIGQVVMTTQTTVNWGLFFFGNEPATCGVTATPTVKVGAMSYAAVNQSFTGTTFNGQAGTPTQAVMRNGLAYLQSLTDMNPRYILLATDGQPNCMNNSLNADDSAGAERAVADALTAGFPTFVVGIGNTGGTATLNQMAINGGRPQVGGATSFYQVTDTPSLVAALQTIVGSVASCTFNLGQPPNGFSSNNAIDVFGDGTKIPKDPTMTDGWNYVGAGDQIQIYGPTCDAILAGTIKKVAVTYRCIVN